MESRGRDIVLQELEIFKTEQEHGRLKAREKQIVFQSIESVLDYINIPMNPVASTETLLSPILTLALIHSPLVTAITWNSLVPALQQCGYSVAIAQLSDASDLPDSWWRQDVESAVASLAELSSPYILVGHSGAGPLLSLIGQRLPTLPAGYIFIDAGILWEPNSRLGMMITEDVVWATEFEAYLREGGTFPNWKEEQLEDIIPNAEMRRNLIHSLRPKPLTFFTETLPVVSGWDSVPCGYLQLSDTYTSYATAAQAKEWVVERMDGHHFSMMTHPDEVASRVSHLVQQVTRLVE